MDNREALTRRVLHGLEVCGMGPEWMEDCEKHGCPYLDEEDGNCISRLCRDARAVILELDNLVNHMEEAPAHDGH